MHTLNGRRICQVAASSCHAIARTSDGSIYCWGYSLDNAGYVRLLKNIELSDENILHRPFLVNSERKLSEKQLDLSSKFVVKKNDITVYKNHFFSDNKIVSIGCTETCNFAVTDKGDVYVFGKGVYGETGTESTEKNIDFPEKITALQGNHITKLVASTYSVFALSGSDTTPENDFLVKDEKAKEEKQKENTQN